MNQQLKLRFVKPADALDWLEKVPEFDKAIMEYPSIRMLCAYNGEPVAYLPMQTALVLESLALKPDVDPVQGAQAMRDLVKGATLAASVDKLKEIYFLATDERIVKAAKKAGFEELKWPALRLKL